MAVKEISVFEASKMLAQGWLLIDVRSPGEWKAVHAKPALNLPLDSLNNESLANISGASKKILFICQSGGRSRKACEALESAHDLEIASVAGGTSTWETQGLDVVKGKGVISIERQVRIVAGCLVVLSSLLALGISSKFLAIPIFVGSGLVFAGVTDSCGMGLLLAKMPWNR